MSRPFEVEYQYLQDHLDEMVDVVFSDLQSQFLVLPKGKHFVNYQNFQQAYEVLKRHTVAFSVFNETTVWGSLREDSLCFAVVRAILGLSPPEWADLARTERNSDISQGFARTLDVHCRSDRTHFSRLLDSPEDMAMSRAKALVSVAIEYIVRGVPAGAADAVHRLDKVDTAQGLTSLQHVASQHVPYAMLLYERYLGRPFASHRDSVSELVGDVMEGTIEEILSRARISFRKTKRAEHVPGYDQAPDFIVPDEFSPAVILEAKIASDDGTARDKVARIEGLTNSRDERQREGRPSFEVVACIDGRGFGERRSDMEKLLLGTKGKVFTLRTLDQLISHTRLQEYLPSAGH